MQTAETKRVPLTKGQFALVDREDYEWLMQWKWSAWWSSIVGRFYALRHGPTEPDGKRPTIRMHRVVIDAPEGFDVDHRNGDTLDNRRSNLRVATRSENLYNQRPDRTRRGACAFKGVSLKEPQQSWAARICLDRKIINLGYFETPEAAAKAYDFAALVLFGEFARTNGTY